LAFGGFANLTKRRDDITERAAPRYAHWLSSTPPTPKRDPELNMAAKQGVKTAFTVRQHCDIPPAVIWPFPA